MSRKTSTLMSLGISIALIAIGIWFLCNHQDRLGYGDGGWIMPGRLMVGGGGMGIVMILFWIAVLSAIGLVISGVISNRHYSGGSDGEASSSATETRKESTSRDETDKSQFDAMKRDLY